MVSGRTDFASTHARTHAQTHAATHAQVHARTDAYSHRRTLPTCNIPSYQVHALPRGAWYEGTYLRDAWPLHHSLWVGS